MGSTEDSTLAADGDLSRPAADVRYELLDAIGRGGMGEVLAARDRLFGRIVALKRLPPDAGAAVRARFESEATITGRLEHAGIPAVYDRGELPDGTPYYAMRRIQGRTLATAIEDSSSLDERLRLVPAVIQVARTVTFAHEHGIIHRDIKPANVLLSEHGEVVLLDWGIAKSRDPATGDSHTRAGEVVGTPAYMAPEQAGGEIDRVDPRTDVFAIGALLYHVLTGRAPYSGSSNVQAVVRAAAGEYEPIRKVARDVPVALREVCERAMARDREDRYKSAAEIATALERCTATALRGGGSRVDVVIAGVVVFVLMGTIMGLTGTLQQTPTFAQQGTGAYGSAVFTGVATAVALAELRTKGRYALATIVLGIALATTFLALAMFGAGLANVASFAQAHPGDPAVLSGIAGASGSLATGASFAAFQIVLWAAIRRVGERSRHNA